MRLEVPGMDARQQAARLQSPPAPVAPARRSPLPWIIAVVVLAGVLLVALRLAGIA